MRARRPGGAKFPRHGGRREPRGHLGPGIQQVPELVRRELGPLGAGLDQRKRPPHVGCRVVRPVARRDDRDDRAHRRARGCVSGSTASGSAASAIAAVGEQVRRSVGSGDDRAGRQLAGRARRRAGPAGRAPPGCGPAGCRPRPARSGSAPPAWPPRRQGPRSAAAARCRGLELPGQVPQLPDLAAVQRPAGGEGEYRPAIEPCPDLRRAQAQPPERAVLRLAARGDLAVQPDQVTPGRPGRGPGSAR